MKINTVNQIQERKVLQIRIKCHLNVKIQRVLVSPTKTKILISFYWKKNNFFLLISQTATRILLEKFLNCLYVGTNNKKFKSKIILFE